MTLVKLRALNRFWRQHPPIDWLMAAYVKFKPPIEPKKLIWRNLPPQETDANITKFFGIRPGMKITG